ncbi:taurine ABC transporter substrate-binding protein [Thermoflavimicrobium dichotomicum]|uniref:Taurine transport system substrate-binding protein n=1 Tax=Thermoflavimicrobium dichotomicum TaxID=46223 RepID=A0A1I3TCZ9_9BACL|nr:aliphatic sulfonate ABC transporter substrate-binding protein [Thermoflavimicrobium dichotomicum]SFJ69004.1 taurine transport system substrate-binding protein [Thermoflavimicrobium dichotomicum]
MSLQKTTNLFLLTIFFAILIFISAACSNQKASSSDKNLSLPKEVRIGYQVSPSGELLAKALGLLEKKYPDVKVEWIQFDSGRDVNNAMASGSIDFGNVGTPPASIGIARGLPYKVYYMHNIIGESEALVVKKEAGIQSLKDLKGKKIATTFSSTSHFSLLGALRTAEIDPEKEKITILDMQPPDIFAAWKRNDIDGAYIWQPTQAKLVNAGGKVILSSKDLAEKGVVTADLGIVQKDFAKKYPDFVKKYIAVLNEAVHYYREKPKESSQLLSKELGLSPEDSLKTMQQIIWLDASQQEKYFGKSGQDGELSKVLKDTGDFMFKQKSIPSSPDLKSYQQGLLK